MNKENHKRTIVKTITWRMLATITTFTLVLIFTGNIELSLSVGFLEVFSKLFIYYLHERAWNKIAWGTTDE